MYNSDTELLFPMRIIPTLSSMRNEEWQQLVADLSANPAEKTDHLAFVLMMAKLGGCMACNADSFRAMRGCTQCAKQTVRRFRGSDKELIDQFKQSRREMESYLNKQNPAEKINGTGKQA
ncbi:MAG: hypothetical protein ABSE06_14835 [Anaerolineaceae bacterium]